MKNYEEMIAEITAKINDNTEGAITGAVLQGVLKEMCMNATIYGSISGFADVNALNAALATTPLPDTDVVGFIINNEPVVVPFITVSIDGQTAKFGASVYAEQTGPSSYAFNYLLVQEVTEAAGTRQARAQILSLTTADTPADTPAVVDVAEVSDTMYPVSELIEQFTGTGSEADITYGLVCAQTFHTETGGQTDNMSLAVLLVATNASGRKTAYRHWAAGTFTTANADVFSLPGSDALNDESNATDSKMRATCLLRDASGAIWYRRNGYGDTAATIAQLFTAGG